MDKLTRFTRSFGSSRTGSGFGWDLINSVWLRAAIAPGKDPSLVRMDACGAIIEYSQYGKTHHLGTGWEIDHIVPVSKGGSDALWNLQPLQWQNNRRKGDNFPSTPAQYSAVVARR